MPFAPGENGIKRDNTVQVTYTRPWLYPKQEHAIFYPRDASGAKARYSLIEASTKTGKTVGCIAWLFEQALRGKKNQNFWWVAPVFKQADIAFRRMKQAYPPQFMKVNESDLTIQLINGAVIWFKSAEKPDNLFGEDVYAAVYDEASRGRTESWHALRSTITATRGPVRFIGNVKGRKNWFYALCRKAQAGEPGMSYHKIIAYDAVQAGILSAQEIEEARRELPEQAFKELYLAEPSDDGGNPFGLNWIAKCVAPLSAAEPVVWGWDLAKKHDWTVGIGLDDDGHTAAFRRFQKPWKETMIEIKRVTGMCPALVDSTGVGDPIVEELQRELGSNFEGYNFSAQSKQKLMEGLALNIQGGTTSYPEGVIKDELENFEYEYTRNGVRYSAPEGFHDDTVCALALANYHKSHNNGLAVWARLGAMS
jgi:hypothetical protein